MNKSTSVRSQGRGYAALLSVAAMATTGLIVAAAPAGAVITSGGNVDDQNRPAFVRDSEGIALALCTDAVNCEPADPADPLHGGYFGAEATVAGLRAVFAIETGAGEDAAGEPTDQAVVASVATFDGRGFQPGARYVIRHPWGTTRVFADEGGRIDRVIEAGGEAGTPLGSGVVTTFLRRLNAPAGFLGNLETAGPVTGSPTGFNRITMTGPGVNETVRNFTVNGQMRADTAMSMVSTTPLRLGSIKKAGPSVANVAVSSFGTAPLAVTPRLSGANPGAFAVTNSCVSVASGQACNVTVTYTPRANRDASAILTIDDNGMAAPRQVVLTGIAHDTRAPKVLSSNSKGATGFAPGKSVKVRFSEAVLGAKSGLSLVDASGDKVAARVSRVRRTNTYVVNPRRSLERDARYTVRVNGGRKALRDLAGNASRDMQWGFRTR